MSSNSLNLQIPLVAQSQNNKEVSFNTAIDMLDEALCSEKAEAITGNFTVPVADFQQSFFQKYTGALSGNATITLPAGIAKLFMVVNDCTGGHNLIFEVGNRCHHTNCNR